MKPATDKAKTLAESADTVNDSQPSWRAERNIRIVEPVPSQVVVPVVSVKSAQPSFGERYRIERELGRGGMATVYLCIDTKFDRKVAIKLLHPDLAAAVGADRFHREIKIATGLTHPNILPAHDSGEAEGSLYYVMPFVDGESLRDRLTRERQLPVQDAVRITCEIASALQYAHTRGIVHRDIKPENILLEADHAVLADFGIARAVTAAADTEALTQTGMSLGTPSYMSPEQAMGEKHIDGRSDQYSLACVMYEMLAGYPPFMANTMQALVAKHLGEPVPLLTTVRPAVPDELEDVVLRALEKVAADRFQTMQEFSDALSGVIATTGTWSRRTTGVRMPAMRQTRSQRVQAQRARAQGRQFAIAAGVVLTLLAAGAGAWRWRSSALAARATDSDSRRIAVLYFSDEGQNGKLQHLADGLTESLIDQLSQISALDVRSRYAVLPFRGKPVSPDSVGRALKIGTLVRGSVEATSRGARVDVQLVDASSGSRIDGKSFEYDTSQVLALQDAVAAQVALFLRERLGDEVRLRERKLATKSSDAWMMLQRAERRRKDADSLNIAGASEAAVVALAEADSQLARAELTDKNWPAPRTLRASVAYAKALALRRQPALLPVIVDSGVAYADQALALDPRNADALEYKGKLLYFRITEHLTTPGEEDRTLTVAESTLTRAVEINKDQAGAWDALSALHYRKPDLGEVVRAAQRAYEADAYLRSSRSILMRLALASYNQEQFPEAMRWTNELKRRFPNERYWVEMRLYLYRSKYQQPDIDSAWAYLNKYVELTPERDRPLARRKGEMLVGGALSYAGLGDSARRVLLRARTSSPDVDPRHELSAVEASVRAIMGDDNEAVRLLKDYLALNPEHRRGFSNRTSWWWRDLAANPKFRAMIAGIK